MGLSVATLTTVRPSLPQQLAGREHKGSLWHDRMFWAAFLPKVQGLACVRSTRAMPPVPNFGPRGLCVMVGLGAHFRSGLATEYVWLSEKIKCG